MAYKEIESMVQIYKVLERLRQCTGDAVLDALNTFAHDGLRWGLLVEACRISAVFDSPVLYEDGTVQINTFGGAWTEQEWTLDHAFRVVVLGEYDKGGVDES